MFNELSLYEIYIITLIFKKGNVTEVASLLSVDRSTLGRNIRDIEEKIKCPLFESIGNQISFTDKAIEIYQQFNCSTREYTEQLNKFNDYVGEIENSISIICQQELLEKLLNTIDDPAQFNKMNIEFFTAHEIEDTDPKAVSLLFEQYDLIVSVAHIYLFDEYNWLKMTDISSLAKIYTNPSYFSENSDPELLEKINLYQSAINNDEETILYFDGKNNIEKKIRLDPKISSDSLLSNIYFASLGYGAVIVPEYLNNLIGTGSILKPMKNITLRAKPIKLYHKKNLSLKKAQAIKGIYKSLKSN